MGSEWNLRTDCREWDVVVAVQGREEAERRFAEAVDAGWTEGQQAWWPKWFGRGYRAASALPELNHIQRRQVYRGELYKQGWSPADPKRPEFCAIYRGFNVGVFDNWYAIMESLPSSLLI